MAVLTQEVKSNNACVAGCFLEEGQQNCSL